MFPNGFDNWYETFYEIVDTFTFNLVSDIGEPCRKLKDIISEYGRGGLWEYAKNLTDKFENIHKDKEWDGEWFDTLEKFLQKELYDN